MGHGDFKSIDQPKRVTTLEDHRIVRIACGGYHTLALTQENLLFAFGSNVSGECGHVEAKNLARPLRIRVLKTRLIYDSLSRLMQEEGESSM